MSKNKIIIKENLHIIEETATYGIIGGCNKEAVKWFYAAKENFKSAQILFDNQQFAHCIFFLQQCIECLTKGILVECDVVVEPRNLSHHPEEAFLKLYEKMNDELNIRNCNVVLTAIEKRNANSFEEKLPIIAEITNDATKQYSNNILSTTLIVQRNATYGYVNTQLFCLAILFRGTEDSSRYPSSSKSPSDLYGTEVIKNALPSMFNLIDSIISLIAYNAKE